MNIDYNSFLWERCASLQTIFSYQITNSQCKLQSQSKTSKSITRIISGNEITLTSTSQSIKIPLILWVMSRCTVSIKVGRDLRTSCRNRVIKNKLTSVSYQEGKKRELVNVSSFKVSTYGIKNMEHAWIKL